MMFIADNPKIVAETLGYLRLLMGKRLNLIDENKAQLPLGHRLPAGGVERRGKAL